MKQIHVNFCTLLFFGTFTALFGEGSVPYGFAVGTHSFRSPYALYCSAKTPGAQNWGLFALDDLGTRPLVTELVTLNYEENKPNPFYNEAIMHVQTFYDKPLFVTKNNPSVLYYAYQQPLPGQLMHIVSAHALRDANGKPSSGIAGISFYQTGNNERQDTYIVCPVRPYEQDFGAPGCGIGLVKFEKHQVQKGNATALEMSRTQDGDEETTKSETETRAVLTTLDAKEGILGGNKAFPLDIVPAEKELVQINGGLEQLGQAVDIFLDENFNRFYIALQVKTKSTAGDQEGACALLVGRVWNNRLCLDSVVPHSVFSVGADNIIGAVGPDRYVSLHKVTTMHSTSGLPYLIVVGGNGQPEETANKVRALPLANMSGTHTSLEQQVFDKEHGGIAKNRSRLRSEFFPGRYGRLKACNFTETACERSDFYTDEDPAVRVGNKSKLPGPVKDIFAARDQVVVLIEHVGAFYSQAIFDQDGRIAAWSCWKKVSGSTPTVLGINIDPNSFNFTFFDSDPQLAIRPCSWKHRANNVSAAPEEPKNLSYVLQDTLPQAMGGVQGLFDFDCTKPGVKGAEQSSLLVATGNKKVVLVQTAHEDKLGHLKAQTLFYSFAADDSGHFPKLVPGEHEVISISGGALDELGPITCATIITDKRQAWLVVGGVGGVAILADKHGDGWLRTKGIGTSFKNLSSELYFQKMGDYQFVQKLVGFNGYLYILTHETLDCAIVFPEMAKADELSYAARRTIVHQQELKACFADVLIARGCIVLATSCGLFFGGEDIANKPGIVTWEKIALPGASQSILKLYCVTPTDNEFDFVHCGQIYVLSGSVTQQEAELYRLFVCDGQIQLVKDLAYKGHASRFISFGAFRDNFATDGLIHISTRSAGWPLAHILPAFLAGKLIASSKGYVVPINAEIFGIRQITQVSATGSWLIGGDFGVCAYE